MNADHAWQATLGQLQMDMSKASYDTWVKNSALISARDGKFVIGVKNSYARDWLETRLTTTINHVLTGIMNQPQEVRFVVMNASDEGICETEDDMTGEIEEQPLPVPARTTNRFNSKYTFENFIVGAGNRLAHAASMAVADHPGQAYNPLFIYGGVGLGKTHLLHAIGNEAAKKGKNALYITSEEFTNELIQAIRNHNTPSFRNKYRDIDILLIDDIQFIAGKESTQEEFFHTFNSLHSHEKQIVICSDRSPKLLMTLEERLRSRFEMGLTADIQAPDLETRQAILRAKSLKSGKQIPHDIQEWIANKFQANIRELEGALNRIIAFSDLSGLPIDNALVQTALADLLPQSRHVEPNQIVNSVASVFKISRERMLSKERTAEIALPRQLAMYIMREDTALSLPQIGSEFGGRDHTTVMYACEKMSSLLVRDDRLRNQAARVRELMYGRAV